MRVVINGRFLAQVRTGVQRYAAETLLALDEALDDPARPSNLEFELAIPPDVAPLTLVNIRCVEVGRRTGHLWEQIDLWRHARGAYLVNFNYSGPLLMRRQLVTIHDATVRAVPQAFSRAYRWTHNLMVAVLGRTAQSVMTVSHFSRDELQRRFGLERDDIIVGVEGGEHVLGGSADAAEVLRKHGLESGKYILGVGSVKPNKNFELIAQAMRLLPGFPWRVAIAGAKNIDIFRDTSNLEDSCVCLGFVDDDELSVLYRHAACFVFPSNYEGFGLPAVEAMAQRCPVLCAHAASMPEVCGDAVLYFDPADPASLADALLRFQSDPSMRESLVAAGLRRLNDYNWRRNAQILLDHLVAIAPRPLDGVAVPPRAAIAPAAPAIPAAAALAVASHASHAQRAKPADDDREMLAAAGDGVLHVTADFASGTLSFLVQATHELLRAGVPQTVLFSRRPDTPADVERRFDPQVRLVELPSPGKGVLAYYRTLRERLLDELAQHPFTAVHLHSSKAGFVGRMALSGRLHPPLFYSPHGLSFLDRKYVVPSLVFKALERIASRVDATLVGCSRGEADLLRAVGGRDVRVVENTVPDEFFAIERQPTKPPVVVTVGRVCRQKGPELFAELAARFQIAEVPASFVWVGNGDAAGEAMLRAAGVKVTGWVSPEQVRHHLAEATVYVQTSLWEGMPLSVLQALAVGLPCVVTDVVGNRDAVRQGITGYVARHSEALAMCVRRLLVDAKLYERMSSAARADARERFTGHNLRERLLALYGLPATHPLASSLSDPPAAVRPTARPQTVDILIADEFDPNLPAETRSSARWTSRQLLAGHTLAGRTLAGETAGSAPSSR